MKKIFLLILASLCLFSCGNKKNPQTENLPEEIIAPISENHHEKSKISTQKTDILPEKSENPAKKILDSAPKLLDENGKPISLDPLSPEEDKKLFPHFYQ